jgi:LmbE family N-acetylglucosaminyl deacetylase
MKPFAPLALAALLTASASAQTTFTDPANLRGERVAPRTGRELPIDQGPSGLQQLLRKLNTRASLMLIVAHPDDEDGGMLTFYSRGLGARVADLSLNRGEGGQNLMTGDFEDALGLLRTQELLSADRYFDADQFFGTEVDFGFSKTKEESFAKWTHERVLYDVVRAIRIYRPLVIASVFIGGVTDGHGQHQVAGQITQEAFKAAGDPNVFPELTREGILPWQPLKVYARVPMQAISPQGLFDYATGQYAPAKFTNYVTGEVTTTTPSVDVTVHEGKIDPLLGPHRAIEDFVSYVQFARQGLGLQKTQISGNQRIPPPGAFDVNYHRYGSMLPPSHQKMQEDSFFDGIDVTLAGIAELAPTAFPELHASLAKIQADINVATDHLDLNDLGKVTPTLAEALRACTSLLDDVSSSRLSEVQKENVLHELRIKRVQLNDALALSLGLTLDATATGANQIALSPVSIWTQIRSQAATPLTVEKVWLTTSQGEVPAKTHGRTETPDLTPDHPSSQTLTATPPYTIDITRPYFFRDNIEQPVYKLKIPALRNAPSTQPAFIAHAIVSFKGVPIELERVVHDGNQPVNIIPPVSVAMTEKAQPLIRYREPGIGVTASAQIAAQDKTKSTPAIHLEVPHGWATEPSNTLPNGETEFLVIPPPNSRELPEGTVTASVSLNGANYTEGYRSIGYGDLPRTNYFTPAKDHLVPLNGHLSDQLFRIAYLPGTGDAVLDAFDVMNLNKPDILSISDLTAANLAKYQTVILGVRTYAAHPDLHGAPTQALLDYARNGGNVVVQYQTGEFTAADAPFPLTLGNAEKVVDETAPVQLLAPDSPLLTTPNKITPADFDNWIEERGHGFLRTWDDRYTALTETHDPGGPETEPQAPQRGGLVTTPLGKGRWTYCAYALYRQLPEAVPGAFRLFVNLINP